MTPLQIASLIRSRAPAYGIDPDQAVKVASSEGLNSYTGDNGSSFGPFQLHYGGVAPGGNAVSGLGDAFTKQTGLDARDPDTIPQQVDFSLGYAAKNGWGPWHGWKGDPFAGISGNPTMAQAQTNMAVPPQPPQSPGRSVLFGGSPVGSVAGTLGRFLGIGTQDEPVEDELGRRLQNAGNALIAVGLPSSMGSAGGAASMDMAANQPHFSIIQDALGNRYALNTRTGSIQGMNGGMGGGGPNGGRATALNQAPVALAKQAEGDADLSSKKMSAMDDAASQAQGLIDMNRLAMEYSKDPNTVQGPGIMNMMRDKIAEMTNGSLGGVDVAKQDELEKINQQLVGQMLQAQKGIRFAAPEIKFGQTASADVDKPPQTNQQIYSTNIQNLQRIIDARDIARAHYNAGYSLQGDEYSKALQDYQDKNPVYQPTELKPSSSKSGDKRPDLNSFYKQ